MEQSMSYMVLIKELALTYQAFEAYSSKHIKKMGITETQFDILATLGNQPPMTCKELGEKTLILKGTMTGVLERLELKGLIEKVINEQDARSYKIKLSKNGEKLFKKVFPEHLSYLEQAFGKLNKKQISESTMTLKALREVFK
jgi:DNA-binding MarR family transcriptional regulator